MPTAAAMAQGDQAVPRAVQAVAAAVVIPVAVPVAAMPPAVQASVIRQPLPVTPQRPRRARTVILPPTRLAFRNHPTRRFNTLEFSGFSNRYRVPVIPRNIGKQTTKIGVANINACFWDLSGIEVTQEDSGLIRKIDPTLLGVPVKERLHLTHDRLVPRLPSVWDIG